MDERDGDDPVDPVDSEDSQVGIGESTYMEWIIDGGGDLFFFRVWNPTEKTDIQRLNICTISTELKQFISDLLVIFGDHCMIQEVAEGMARSSLASSFGTTTLG